MTRTLTEIDAEIARLEAEKAGLEWTPQVGDRVVAEGVVTGTPDEDGHPVRFGNNDTLAQMAWVPIAALRPAAPVTEVVAGQPSEWDATLQNAIEYLADCYIDNEHTKPLTLYSYERDGHSLTVTVTHPLHVPAPSPAVDAEVDLVAAAEHERALELKDYRSKSIKDATLSEAIERVCNAGHSHIADRLKELTLSDAEPVESEELAVRLINGLHKSEGLQDNYWHTVDGKEYVVRVILTDLEEQPAEPYELPEPDRDEPWWYNQYSKMEWAVAQAAMNYAKGETYVQPIADARKALTEFVTSIARTAPAPKVEVHVDGVLHDLAMFDGDKDKQREIIRTVISEGVLPAPSPAQHPDAEPVGYFNIPTDGYPYVTGYTNEQQCRDNAGMFRMREVAVPLYRHPAPYVPFSIRQAGPSIREICADALGEKPVDRADYKITAVVADTIQTLQDRFKAQLRAATGIGGSTDTFRSVLEDSIGFLGVNTTHKIATGEVHGLRYQMHVWKAKDKHCPYCRPTPPIAVAGKGVKDAIKQKAKVWFRKESGFSFGHELTEAEHDFYAAVDGVVELPESPYYMQKRVMRESEDVVSIRFKTPNPVTYRWTRDQALALAATLIQSALLQPAPETSNGEARDAK